MSGQINVVQSAGTLQQTLADPLPCWVGIIELSGLRLVFADQVIISGKTQ